MLAGYRRGLKGGDGHSQPIGHEPGLPQTVHKGARSGQWPGMRAGRAAGDVMRAAISGAAVTAMVGAALVGAPAATAAGVPVCEVVTLAQPSNGQGGVVMDLERVPGLGTVYAGSVNMLGAGGSVRQRPVVWSGIDGTARRVGPRGMEGVVHELRPSGWISGQSVDRLGREYAWVQNLRSGGVTIVDAGVTERFWVQHINDAGEAAGSVWVSDTETEARVWEPQVSAPGRVLPHDALDAQAWDITNDGRVAGSVGLGEFRYQAVTWDADGTLTRLASNPGSVVDTSARLINERGEAAGHALWGDQFTGHYEAARWRTPTELESLGLLPDGGFSAALGQSEGGWIVGVAEHWSPDGANPDLGPGIHAVLWMDEVDHVRVLPSPHAVANRIDDWRQWQSSGAYAVDTRLDQVGGSAQSALPGDGFRFDPVVYLHASQCGERVPTTHTAHWEQPPPETSAAATEASQPVAPRPDGYDRAAIEERLSRR
jgi:hypothetical protein